MLAQRLLSQASAILLLLAGPAALIACGGDEKDDPETYAVGGTVSGLNGTLVLQNNGGDDLTITGDGAFRFATALEDGEAYSVTVRTWPNLQRHTISGEAGTIDGADATGILITLTDKVWSHPADLTDAIDPGGQGVGGPQVAMDDNDNAIIVWRQSDGNFSQIFKSEYRNGSWTHPSDVSDNISPDGQDATYPISIAMNGGGNAFITWSQLDGSNYQVFVSEYRNGSWTHPSDVSDNISPNGQDAAYPEVATDSNGNAIVVWYQNDGNVLQVFKSEYRNGSWTHPSDLSDNISPDGQGAFDAKVAMDDNDNAIIVWSQVDGSNDQIYKSEYRNGSWTHPSDLTDNISPDGDTYEPKVAMSANGDAVVTWTQSVDVAAQIFVSEHRSGTWTHPADLTDNISPDGQSASGSRVAVDSDGNVIVVWRQSDGSNKQIFKSEYWNGSWTHPSDLSDNISPDGQNTYQSCLAMDDHGNAIVVWGQNDGSHARLFMSEFH